MHNFDIVKQAFKNAISQRYNGYFLFLKWQEKM